MLESFQKYPGIEQDGAGSNPQQSVKRPITSGSLLGKHIHKINGVPVYIQYRDDRFLARGRFEGKTFRITLGSTEGEAQAQLLRILGDIERGTFTHPSNPEARHRRRQNRPAPSLTLAELVEVYLAAKRKRIRKATIQTYRSRLGHVLAFVESGDNQQCPPLAQDWDQNTAADLKTFLTRREVARNGKTNSPKKAMTASGIRLVLETLKVVFQWGKTATPRNLPEWFINPITPEIIGNPPSKDPMRTIAFSLERRIRLVRASDRYQLINMGLLYLLPLRPEQLAGLLIPEISWQEQTLWFGTRFGEHDFTKGRTTFRVPYPRQLEVLLRAAVGNRRDGPVFLSRSVFEKRKMPDIELESGENFTAAVQQALAEADPEDYVNIDDGKAICRAAIAKAGGVTENALAKEFHRLAIDAGIEGNDRFYDLRSSVHSEMLKVGVPEEYRRYCMGHRELSGGSLDDYTRLDIDSLRTEMMRYWEFAGELIEAIVERAKFLGIGADDASGALVNTLIGAAA